MWVVNNYRDINIKLLLIDRPAFRGIIKHELDERYVPVQYFDIGKGDIIAFLKTYFTIEGDVANRIAEESRGNFVIAILLAELYREKGIVKGEKEAIEHRIAKYIGDIKKKEGIAEDKIKDTLYLLSLITPIKWNEDRKILEECMEYLPEYEFQHLRSIIGLAGREFNFFLLRADEKYIFRYDIIGDYLLSQFINTKEELFLHVIKQLLAYMPFRISYNVFVIPRFFREELNKVNQILSAIWDELNNIRGHTPEYFSALVLFTGDFSSLPFFDIDIEKMEISHWLSCYEDVSKTYPDNEEEVREVLATGLVNSIAVYGRKNEFDKMEACLNELRSLYKRHPAKEVREKLAKGLVNSIYHYGRKDEFDKMETCLNELRSLYKRHPAKEVREKLAKGLVNSIADYGRKDVFDKMEACLNELRSLHEQHPVKEVRGKLAMGLFNAIYHYEKAGRADKIDYNDMLLLYKLRFDLPDDANRERNKKIIEDWFMKATRDKIEEVYNDDNYFCEFINMLKSDIDPTELVVLMNRISDSLEIQIQRRLWSVLQL